MALEDLTGATKFIDDLVETNPTVATDKKFQGDDHIRGVKNVLKNSFPAITGAVTSTQAELNTLDGYTGDVADLNLLAGEGGGGKVLTGDTGTKGVWFQNAAPTGWMIDATVDEHAIRLTKGSVAGGQAGGALGGTNNFSTQFASLAEGATPGVGDHALAANEVPDNLTTGTEGGGLQRSGPDHTGTAAVAHGHTVDLRVKWAACIVATKD